jgi:hypothetical protein
MCVGSGNIFCLRSDLQRLLSLEIENNFSLTMSGFLENFRSRVKMRSRPRFLLWKFPIVVPRRIHDMRGNCNLVSKERAEIIFMYVFAPSPTHLKFLLQFHLKKGKLQ